MSQNCSKSNADCFNNLVQKCISLQNESFHIFVTFIDENDQPNALNGKTFIIQVLKTK